MNKYHVYLAQNWMRPEPFVTEWDYELLGDALRAQFDVYFAEQEALAGAGVGKTKQLFKGEYIKKFMITKRVNLVDNPATGNLKSVFILRVGEKKLIDERARKALGGKFEYKFRRRLDGTDTDPEGFLLFELVEGSEVKKPTAVEQFKVSGTDIAYFDTEEPEAVNEEVTGKIEERAEEKVEKKKEEKVEKVEEKPKFACENCGKEFDGKRQLNGHKLSCKKK